jgi:hypothetical protein
MKFIAFLWPEHLDQIQNSDTDHLQHAQIEL